jgi:hypothetical protein
MIQIFVITWMKVLQIGPRLWDYFLNYHVGMIAHVGENQNQNNT